MATKTLVKTKYNYYAASPCVEHGEHVVSGFTENKASQSKLQKDLRLILVGDNPGCQLRPRVSHPNNSLCYRLINGNKEKTVWEIEGLE